MKYCDLHNHTKYSDGSSTPKELCMEAKEKGLSAIAITDHNTVKGIFEFEECAKAVGIEYALGAEITTQYKGKEAHIIALFIDKASAPLVEAFTKEIQQIKRESNKKLAENLTNGGYRVAFEELEKRFGNNINRSHFGTVLMEMGVVGSIDEAFEGILKEGNGYYSIEKRVEALEAVEKLKAWGCVPVLAHPLLNFTSEELEELLPNAKKNGLVGIEAYYSKFTNEQTEYLLCLCEKFGLIPSGGSDYHGKIKNNRELGSARVPLSSFEALKNIKEKNLNLR